MVVDDAKNLFNERAEPVLQSMLTALNRLTDAIKVHLSSWKEYVIETVDVQRIKTELINSNSSPALVAMIKTTTECIDVLLKATTAMGIASGTVYQKTMGAAQLAIDNSRLQIGASAICIALYRTVPDSAAKASTKLGSVKQVKTLLTSLSIANKLPLALMNKLNAAIHQLDKDCKIEAKEKEQKKK